MAPVNSGVKPRGEASPLSATLPAGAPPAFIPSSSDRTALAAPPTVVETRRSEAISSAEAPPRAPDSSSLAQTLKTTPPSRPVSSERTSGPISSPRIQDFPPPSSRGRGSLASYDEVPVDGFGDEGRRARSRWIAAVVILGLVAVFALTLGRQYLKRLNPQQAGSVSAADDERVNRFLKDGTKLLEDGDVEGAKEQFVKAQALADKNPRVLAALARLETVRADITWLKLRLLDPQSTDLVQSTHRDLGRRVGKAREAAEAAFKVDPEAPAVVRARVDAFRLSGEPAREWLGPIAAKPQDPENAYVLAALDLAEQTPDLENDIKRLELAAASPRERIRGRAALIYALGRAGRLPDAERHVATLEGEQPPHPLLEELKSFVARLKGAVDAGADAVAAPAATVDVSKLPALDTSPAADGARAEPKGDFRKRLVQANEALRAGNLARAEQLYQSVLSEQPGNTEALSGLADVARRNNDHSTAGRLYKRVLEQNPSYLPALIATADAKWNSGDHKGAVALYKRVLDQAGAGTEYGQRAAARIAEAAKEGGEAPAEKKEEPAPEKAAPAPEQPAPPSEPAPAPSIDTTDLPGIK
jgi:tetratricopeptide (TPR) repeat protein